MTSESLIELGEDWTLPEEPRRGRRGMTGPTRAVLVCALAAVSLGLLGASAAPPEPLISLVAVVPRPAQMAHGQDIRMFGDVLVANWSGAVVAYGLDGKKRWDYRSSNQMIMVSTYGDGASPPLILVTESILVPVEDTQERHLVSDRTVALDPLTGDEIWSVDGFLSQVGEVLIGRDNEGDVRVYRGSPPKSLWRTGVMRASTLDVARGTVLGLTRDGLFHEFELATGKLLRQQRMNAPAGDDPVAMWSVGDRIFLSTDGVGGGNIVAYDRRTLSRAPWNGSWYAVFTCGRAICAHSISASGTLVVDPGTGGVLWESSDWLFETDAGIISTGEAYGPSVPVFSLLDPWTGAVREPLDGWQITGPRPEGIEILVRSRHGRTDVALLEARGLRIIGAVPHRVNDCNYWDGVLICDVENGDLGVWRLERWAD